MSRVLLIDGSNLYRSSRGLGFNIDYKKLLDIFNGDGQLFRAYYFTALPPKEVLSPIRKLADWLGYNGYNLITKETKTYINDDGEPKLKGNMDLEIAATAVEVSEHVTEIVLFSGDGDFSCVVELLQRKYGKRVICVSSMKLVSDTLRRQVDKYIDLSDLRKDIQQEQRHVGS